MNDSRTSNVIKNSGASVLNKLAHTILQFVLRTVFIHLLGNEYTGISSLFTDILQVLSLMELGLDSSMVYSLYTPIAQKDERRIHALMNFYRKAFNIIGVAVLCAGALCVPFLGHIVKDVPSIHEDIRGIFMMYVATTAFSYFIVYKTTLIRANQQSRIISNYTTAVYIAETIVEIVLLFVFRQYYAYLVVHFVATIFRNIILSRKAEKLFPGYLSRSDEKLSKADTRKLLRDMACLTVYSAAGVVIYSTDSIFISSFIGTVEVAIVGNFSLIINNVRNLVSQVVSATKPSIGNLAATESTMKQEQIFRQMNFICFCCACFACTCFYALLNPFIGNIWLNEFYKLSMPIIAVMVLNFFIAIMVYPVESFRTANGLFVQGWARPAIMAVMNIVLDFYMGKEWGIFGIFLATTISRALTQVWFDPYLVHKVVFKAKPFEYFKSYISYLVITAASCLIAYHLCRLIVIPWKYLDFLVDAIISCVVPVALILVLFRNSDLLNAFTGRLKRMAGKVMKRRR